MLQILTAEQRNTINFMDDPVQLCPSFIAAIKKKNPDVTEGHPLYQHNNSRYKHLFPSQSGSSATYLAVCSFLLPLENLELELLPSCYIPDMDLTCYYSVLSG